MGAYNPPPELARMIADLAARVAVLERLQSRAIDTGGQSIGLRFGLATVTYSAASPNAQQTVTHNLGRIPAAFGLAVTGADDVIAVVQGGTVTTTQFVLVTSTKTGANLGIGQQRSSYWLAIG